MNYELKRITKLESVDDFDDIRTVTNCLRHHCEGKETFKAALPILIEKTGLTEERITDLVKKHFKDGNHE